MNVLVIAAHPDDEVLGCGGSIAKHAGKGDNVSVCFMCESFSARYESSKWDGLKDSARRSADILGVKKIYFFDVPNIRSNTVPMSEITDKINRCLNEVLPDVVYTHHCGDVNIDHRVVFDGVMLALRSFGKHPVKEVYCFEVPSSTEWAPSMEEYQFVPNVFVDISKTEQKKIEAMNAYKSEVKEYPHPRSIEALRLYAENWGIKSGMNCPVEAFELVRFGR